MDIIRDRYTLKAIISTEELSFWMTNVILMEEPESNLFYNNFVRFGVYVAEQAGITIDDEYAAIKCNTSNICCPNKDFNVLLRFRNNAEFSRGSVCTEELIAKNFPVEFFFSTKEIAPEFMSTLINDYAIKKDMIDSFANVVIKDSMRSHHPEFNNPEFMSDYCESLLSNGYDDEEYAEEYDDEEYDDEDEEYDFIDESEFESIDEYEKVESDVFFFRIESQDISSIINASLFLEKFNYQDVNVYKANGFFYFDIKVSEEAQAFALCPVSEFADAYLISEFEVDSEYANRICSLQNLIDISRQSTHQEIER